METPQQRPDLTKKIALPRATNTHTQNAVRMLFFAGLLLTATACNEGAPEPPRVKVSKQTKGEVGFSAENLKLKSATKKTFFGKEFFVLESERGLFFVEVSKVDALEDGEDLDLETMPFTEIVQAQGRLSKRKVEISSKIQGEIPVDPGSLKWEHFAIGQAYLVFTSNGEKYISVRSKASVLKSGLEAGDRLEFLPARYLELKKKKSKPKMNRKKNSKTEANPEPTFKPSPKAEQSPEITQSKKLITIRDAQEKAKELGLKRLANKNSLMYLQRLAEIDPKIIPPEQFNYRWKAWVNKGDEKGCHGSKQCAYFASAVLSLREFRHGRVVNLASRVIATNLYYNGETGIKFGFNEFKQGDLVVWGDTKYRHIGVVRGNLELNDEKYVAVMDHNGRYGWARGLKLGGDGGKRIDIIPVRKNAPGFEHTRQNFRKRSFRNQQNEADQRMLTEILRTKDYDIHVVPNDDFYADGANPENDQDALQILFAINTNFEQNLSQVD